MTIMLEMAKATREQKMWERRFHALEQMYPIERIFADRDGKWGLRDFLAYAGEVCGFPPSIRTVGVETMVDDLTEDLRSHQELRGGHHHAREGE